MTTVNVGFRSAGDIGSGDFYQLNNLEVSAVDKSRIYKCQTEADFPWHLLYKSKHLLCCVPRAYDANAAPAPARQHQQCSLDKSRGFYTDNRPSSVQCDHSTIKHSRQKGRCGVLRVPYLLYYFLLLAPGFILILFNQTNLNCVS